MKALTFVTLFLFSAMLQAASVELSWQHPTARTDGQPLDVSEISHTAVAWQCGDQPEGSLLVDAPAASVTIDDLPKRS